MAVTIVKSPPEISFSRIPVWFGLQTDNLYSNAGQAAVSLISFPNGPLPENITFDLTYNGTTQTFTVKNYPDNSGLQILSGKNHPLIADLTLQEWCEQFVASLAENFLISRDYLVTVDNTGVDPRVKFSSIVSDPKYDLSLAVNANIALVILANGIDKKRHPNFALYLEIWMQNEDHTAFEKIQEDIPLDVDDDGFAYPNLSRTLTEALIGKKNDFERPDPALPAVMRNLKTCRQYYIRYAESYGTIQQVKKVQQSPNHWVMLGGVGKAAESAFSIPLNFYAGGYHKFLKQESLNKSIGLQQAEWLSLVWLAAPIALINLHVKVFFTAGNPSELNAFTANEIAKYDKITFPSGPTQLNLPGLFPDKIITYYEVWITDGLANRLSEMRSYYLKYDFESSARVFASLSSLGCYDTFYTTGKGSSEYELTVKRAIFSKTVDFKFEDGETMDFDSSLEHKEVVLTGHITKRDLKRYRDFFISWDKFQIRNLRTYPVQVNTRNVKEYQDEDFIFSMEFETAYRFTEELWTEDADDTVPTMPVGMSQYLPAISNPNPDNWDHLYYRKSQTFNQAEVIAFIDNVLAIEAAHHATQQGLIDALQLAVVGKANAIHFHDDRYLQIGDFNNFADVIGAALFQKGAWDPAYTIDPLDPGVLPGYSIDNLVDHDLKQWRSLVDENTSEPGTDPLKWVLVLNDISDVETATDRTWSSQKIVDIHYNKTQSDLRYAALSHTHIIANVTGLQAELDGKAALSHTHAIANVTGLQAALDAKAALVHTHVIGDITDLQAALDAKEALANKNIANGYAGLDGAGLIPSSLLPSYVDDVLEYANFAALPATGVSSKIYVTLNTNKTYRWSGSAYPEISASPGSTDAVPEGSVNLYHTSARVQAIGDGRYLAQRTFGTAANNNSGDFYATGSTVANSILLNGLASSSISAVNSIAARDANGDIYARLFSLNPAYGNYAPAKLVGTSAGGQIREMSLAQAQTYLGLGSNAYTSTNYLPVANPTFTGTLMGPSATLSGNVNGYEIWASANYFSKGTSPTYYFYNTAATVQYGSISHNASNMVYNTSFGSHVFNQSASFSGTLNTNAENAINATNAGTGRRYGLWSNTSGSILWGIEPSTGGSLFTGAPAYSAVIGSNAGGGSLTLGTNGFARYWIDVSGNNVWSGLGTFQSGVVIANNSILSISNGSSASRTSINVYGTGNGYNNISVSNNGGSAWFGVMRDDAISPFSGSGAFAGYVGTSNATNFIITTNSVMRVVINGGSGAATFSSTVTAAGGGFNSDLTLKNVLTRDLFKRYIGNKVSPFMYTWNDNPLNQSKDKLIQRLGYGAQEMLALFPESVYKVQDGTYAVDYIQVHTLLIDENTKRIQELEKEVAALKMRLN